MFLVCLLVSRIVDADTWDVITDCVFGLLVFRIVDADTWDVFFSASECSSIVDTDTQDV